MDLLKFFKRPRPSLSSAVSSNSRYSGTSYIHLNQYTKKDTQELDYTVVAAVAANSLMVMGNYLSGTLVTQRLMEHLPMLLCDIGPLHAWEIDLVLSKESYRLDYRYKGSTGLMKHTQTFKPLEVEVETSPTKEGQPEMTEQSNSQSEEQKPQTIVINELLNHGWVIDTGSFQSRIDTIPQDFWASPAARGLVISDISSSFHLLASLTHEHLVCVKINAVNEGDPKQRTNSWEFTCVRRSPSYSRPLGGGQAFNFNQQAFHDHTWAGRYYGDRRFSDDNSTLIGVLDHYSLTQISRIPSAFGSHLPGGLDLLDLVKERLAGQSGNRYNPFNTMHCQANPTAYTMGPDQTYVKTARFNENYKEFVTWIYPGEPDTFLGAAVDVKTGTPHLVTLNKTRGVFKVTTLATLASAAGVPNDQVYPVGSNWCDHPGLMEVFGVDLIPCVGFQLTVQDNSDLDLLTINTRVAALPMPDNLKVQVFQQITRVLTNKPIDLPEGTSLFFAMGPKGSLSDGLEEAIGDPRFCNWVIFTPTDDDRLKEGMMPDSFWTVDKNTPPPPFTGNFSGPSLW